MSTTHIDISVVIGFKDWGIDRLYMSVRSVQESFGDLAGEVIVSDYGSEEYVETERIMNQLGAKYLYTPTDGTWSRSRALNAGFAISGGRVLVSTDADMIFSPSSMEIIGKRITSTSNLSLLLQCRDLPEGYSHSELAENGSDWKLFETQGRLRPRWGMGGMMATSRDTFERIRGFDERMHTYGGEDIDFVYRVRRAGQRVMWIDDPRVRMFHMWHPPTRKELDKSEVHLRAIEANKKIVYEDPTYVRNIVHWNYPLWDAKPLVTIAISTYNRATFLTDAIHSALNQTIQDFEILVIDDGSTDETRRAVEAIGDGRIRYIWQENQGISVARNLAAVEARGRYTAVLDDDDIMTPWRLEKHLEHITSDVHGSFGSFVNFDEESGEMKLFASKKLNAGTILHSGGAPGHGTWMVETEILRRIGYDESLTSGVDNNLALRMVRAGVKMNHSGEIMMLRRMHTGQVTFKDEDIQKTSARQSRKLFEFATTKWGAEKLNAERGSHDWVKIRFGKQLDQLLPFLPDTLVERTAKITTWPEGLEPRSVGREFGDSTLAEIDEDGHVVSLYGELCDVELRDMAKLRTAGVSYEVTATLKVRGKTVPRARERIPMSVSLPEAVNERALRIMSQYTLPVVGFVPLEEGTKISVDRSVVMLKRRFQCGDSIRNYTFLGFACIEDAAAIAKSPHMGEIEFVADGSFSHLLEAVSMVAGESV